MEGICWLDDRGCPWIELDCGCRIRVEHRSAATNYCDDHENDHIPGLGEVTDFAEAFATGNARLHFVGVGIERPIPPGMADVVMGLLDPLGPDRTPGALTSGQMTHGNSLI